MKIIHCPLNLQTPYPLQKLAPLNHLLFFDIETTGFSSSSSFLYLIGCIYYDNPTNHWELLQWFADSPESEPELLTSFFTHLQQFSTVIHFNGSTFDCPFLLKRCRYHHLSFDFSQTESIDIYQKIRPYQKLLKLDALKLKSIEQFLQIHRTDSYQGSQLIKLYHDYLITRSEALCRLLLLHNEEDLKGMFHILPILSYPDIAKRDVKLISQNLLYSDNAPTLELALELTGKDFCPIPIPFQTNGAIKDSFIHGQASSLICQIPLYQGELKLFYPDYKNYYYLPYEDMAVHKSIGAYVSKTARQKASAKTCYTRQSGLFLPQLSPLWQPVFQKDYRDEVSYVRYQENRFTDSKTIRTYLHQLFPLPAPSSSD